MSKKLLPTRGISILLCLLIALMLIDGLSTYYLVGFQGYTDLNNFVNDLKMVGSNYILLYWVINFFTVFSITYFCYKLRLFIELRTLFCWLNIITFIAVVNNLYLMVTL